MKKDFYDILFYLPIICLLAIILLLADRTGKIGVFGSMITLFINTDNYELRFKKKLSEKTKLKVVFIKELSLSFYCSCYMTMIVRMIIYKPEFKWLILIICPTLFFLIIWLYIRRVIPYTIELIDNYERKNKN